MLVDLRSDTVTRPTTAMRAAMASADVGDDVYGEDPTVRRLEERVAGMFDRAAAVFVPSGTMGNQIALRLVCPPAGEVLCDADAHIVSYEDGGPAQHGGIQTRTLVAERGLLDPGAVAAQVRPPGFHTGVTRALAVEQTHNRGGGAVYPLAVLEELRSVADDGAAQLHCDGARIWNASVASGTPLATYGRLFDTLSVCLSKGLGAPIGSLVVCSSVEQAEEARVLRHRLGGAWRQAGILAAAGLVALDQHVGRLAEDHARARRLAGELGAAVPETNIVLVEVPDAPGAAAAAAADGILVAAFGPRLLRLVTHLDVDDAGIDHALKVLTPLVA